MRSILQDVKVCKLGKAVAHVYINGQKTMYKIRSNL